MDIPKVGETTTNEEIIGRRDAFHVPGVLVQANALMLPGDRVNFTDDSMTMVRDTHDDNKYQAVVDPFIPAEGVGPGTMFWVFPIPGSTSPVRHDFDITIDPASHEDDPDDDSCAGCYGEEVDDDACKGCYE